MPKKKKPEDQRRDKLNLTIHPEIRKWADSISGRRRRSISHVFEELVEAEWHRFQGLTSVVDGLHRHLPKIEFQNALFNNF
jgi:hypothetical protein